MAGTSDGATGPVQSKYPFWPSCGPFQASQRLSVPVRVPACLPSTSHWAVFGPFGTAVRCSFYVSEAAWIPPNRYLAPSGCTRTDLPSFPTATLKVLLQTLALVSGARLCLAHPGPATAFPSAPADNQGLGPEF